MNYDAAARRIRDADLAVAFTGAGISTASGVPDFRSDGGIWERYDESDFSIARFQDDPAGFWQDWLDLREEFGGAEPNPAHEALADMESAGALDAVVTQNVDGLHRRAGSERIVHLHGTGDRVECRNCGENFDAEAARTAVGEGSSPPRCPSCDDGVLEPDSVLFGEPLPRDAYDEARSLAERSDVFLVVGSSLTVEPAASLPELAADWDATLIVVNREPTPVADEADHVARDDASEVLPALADRVLEED